MNTDALEWPDPGPSLARALTGEFRLCREIGRGGMGVVYLAEDMRLQRNVAIKTLLPHLAGDPAVRERFVRESRTAASLAHPGIVPIHAAADHDGVVYFVMGYVDGESLADRLARSGPLHAYEAMGVVRQLAMALAYAHKAGVVHRDIKAENVLIDASGRAFITDFGIARVGEAQPLTATGTVLGSVQYMSPEQVTAEKLDGRSDIYALGVLLFHLLTVRFPFERPQASAVLVAHVMSPVPDLSDYMSDVSPELNALIKSMLAKRVEDRVQSASDLVDRIDALLSASTVTKPEAAGEVNPVEYPVRAGSIVGGRLSSDEAEQLWKRASELQANTGLFTAPPAPDRFAATKSSSRSSSREGTKDIGEPLTRGYDLEIVREAAIEAGIDERYVDRALAERNEAQAIAAATDRPVEITVGAEQKKPPNPLIGAYRALQFEAVIDGEIPASFFDEMADMVRRDLNKLVSSTVVGRTLTINVEGGWKSANSTSTTAQIQVALRNGKTIIRAYQSLRNEWGGIVGGIGFGAGSGIATASFGAGMGSGVAAPQAILIAGSLLLAINLGARAIFVHTSRKREREMRALVERMARVAQEELARLRLKSG